MRVNEMATVFKEYKVRGKLLELRVGDSVCLQIESCYKTALRMVQSTASREGITLATELLKAIDKNDNVKLLLTIERIK
jgi:hypothetical protein